MRGRLYQTEYGKRIDDIVFQYKSLWKYYDTMTGCVVIPIDEYNASKKIQDEVYNLLKSGNIKTKLKDGKTKFENWALEVHQGDYGDGEKEYAGIRLVESF